MLTYWLIFAQFGKKSSNFVPIDRESLRINEENKRKTPYESSDPEYKIKLDPS